VVVGLFGTDAWLVVADLRHNVFGLDFGRPHTPVADLFDNLDIDTVADRFDAG